MVSPVGVPIGVLCETFLGPSNCPTPISLLHHHLSVEFLCCDFHLGHARSPPIPQDMRLINTTTLELHDFPFGSIPPYAILSHTWQGDEVTFHDIGSGGAARKKRGFEKIRRTCRIARQQGLEFAWIDSCCIDKSSSAELSEAINSMYQWYQRSEICYTALEDLLAGQPFEEIRNCRWVTRGWTLQELIAPARVEFYDKSWEYRGTKMEHAEIISKSTGVPRSIILFQESVSGRSVASRMSWSARRTTTRPEDMAYCLLGLLDVNMPLLYGEGTMAFRRLQEEILRRNDDCTILAWSRQLDGWSSGLVGVLAQEPSDFWDCGSITGFTDDSYSISVTNKGLLISGDTLLRVVAPPDGKDLLYMLCLGDTGRGRGIKGIILSRLSPNTFCRIGAGIMDPSSAGLKENPGDCFESQSYLSPKDFYLLTDPSYAIVKALRHRRSGIHLPDDPSSYLATAIPQALWDDTNRIFLRPKPYNWHSPIFEALALLIYYEVDGQRIELVILCNYEDSVPRCELHARDVCPRNLQKALDSSNDMTSLLWSELESVDSLPRGQQYVDFSVNDRNVRVALALDEVGEAPSSWYFPAKEHPKSESPFSYFALSLKRYNIS